MVFKRLLGSLGVGGPTVDTVLDHGPFLGPGGLPGDHGHRSGPGMGTAIAAGAAGLAVGVAGGMVAAEVVDEVGDLFEGEEDGGDEG